MSDSTELPEIISKKIEDMLDEDCLNRPGTAEKASKYLLERSIKVGREKQFKAAMKFWKNSHNLPEKVLYQWFEGVFKDLDKKPAKKGPSETRVKASKAGKKSKSQKS